MDEIETKLKFLEEQIAEIKNSTAWHLVKALWRIRLRVAPHGSRREHTLLFLKWALSTWKEKGFVEVLRSALDTLSEIQTPLPDRSIYTDHLESGWIKTRKRWFPTPRRFRVLFLNGMTDSSESPRYRIDNVCEALQLEGVPTSIITTQDLPEKIPFTYEHDLVVIFRARWDDRIEELLEICRRYNIPTVFDIDDYAFGFGHTAQRYSEIITGWSKKLLDWYMNTTYEYYHMLRECDFFTGSTQYLVEKAVELGKTGFVIRNSLSWNLIELSRKVRLKRRFNRADDITKIVYASGTKTHQRDFQLIVPALVQVLKERANVSLMVIGHLDIDEFPELKRYKRRIKKFSFVQWQKLPELIGKADINIVPLEIGVPFCEAKSELKYFEAGAIGLVTVASATDTFKLAIRDGETGILCKTIDGWYKALIRLIDEPGEREKLAQGANYHAMTCYSPAALASEAIFVYRNIIQSYRQERGLDGNLQIGWIIPTLGLSIETYETIFSTADELINRGHQVAIFLLDDKLSNSYSKAISFIKKCLGKEPSFGIVVGTNKVFSCDVLIATDPKTAHIVDMNRERTFLPCFFILDFALQAFPLGTDYLDLERAYSLDLFQVVRGKPLTDLLSTRFGIEAKKIDSWIDRSSFYPSDKSIHAGVPWRILFWVQPEVTGVLFRFAERVLAGLLERNLIGEVHVMGDDAFLEEILSDTYEVVSNLNKEERGLKYREFDLCLTTSRPSSFIQMNEMMACGLPVIDISQLHLFNKDNIGVVSIEDTDHNAIVDVLIAILEDKQKLQQLQAEAIRNTSHLLDTCDAINQFVNILEEEVLHRWEMLQCE